jgi:EAL domain-containing protein (putative c-di-GMP-specific phosphodiesterase class I)
VQLIVKASQDLNVAVIATGVDTETDLEVCKSLDCTLAQGKLFGTSQTVASLIHASRTPPRERQAAR